MKKSGGETQTRSTLVYLLVLLISIALMNQVNLATAPVLLSLTKRLVKWIVGGLKNQFALRRFGLQAIISAPSDKVAILALVDETLVVLRGKNHSTVQLFARRGLNLTAKKEIMEASLLTE